MCNPSTYSHHAKSRALKAENVHDVRNIATIPAPARGQGTVAGAADSEGTFLLFSLKLDEKGKKRYQGYHKRLFLHSATHQTQKVKKEKKAHFLQK